MNDPSEIHSIRERILQTLCARLAMPAAALGATVWRSPVVAITRSECPALVLFAESETVLEHASERVTRELNVRITALSRAVPPELPETQSDELLCAAHTVLMQDVNLGALALGLREIETEWDVEDADAVACAIAARYRITYRTQVHDLSLQG